MQRATTTPPVPLRRASTACALTACALALPLAGCSGGGGGGGDSTQPPRLAAAGFGVYYGVNPSNGRTRSLSTPGLRGVDPLDIAYDSASRTVYAMDQGTRTLVAIDIDTGAMEYRGSTGFDAFEGLTFDTQRGVLYGAEATSDFLYEIDPDDASRTQLVAVGDSPGLAFDPTGSGFVYGVDDAGDVFTLDLGTNTQSLDTTVDVSNRLGAAFQPSSGNLLFAASTSLEQLPYQPPGALPFFTVDSDWDLEGLAFDPTGDVALAVDRAREALIAIQLSPLDDAVVTPLSAGGVTGLAFDPASRTILATDFVDESLIAIDRDSGLPSYIGAHGAALAAPQAFLGDLAYDPNAQLLYGCDPSFDDLYVVDPSTGTATNLGDVPFGGVSGMAFDPNSNTLFGYDIDGGDLVRIDIGNPVNSTAVGGTISSVDGLAFDPATDTLYGLDTNASELVTIDTTTGAATTVGTIAVDSVFGLTWDTQRGVLYTARTGDDAALYEIDPQTAVVRTVGLAPDLRGLARDESSDALWGVGIEDGNRNQLYAIDDDTGEATPIGAPGPPNLIVNALAYDSLLGILYGATSLGQLLTIDTATGAITTIGAPNGNAMTGLCHDPTTGTLYAVDLTTTALSSVDTATGALTQVIDFPPGVTVVSLAYDAPTDRIVGTTSIDTTLVRFDLVNMTFEEIGETGTEFQALAGRIR